jgi:hypothetical protein
MPQRTDGAGLPSTFGDGLRGMLSRLQAKEHEPVPTCTGHALGHSAEGSEPPALVFKPIHQHLYLDGLAAELALEHHARERQSLVATGAQAGAGSRSRRLGCGQAEVPVVGNLQGASPRPLRQPTLEVGLQAPGDSAQEEDPVPGPRLFPEEFLIAGYQHRDGRRSQVFGLLGPGDVFMYFHGFSVYFGATWVYLAAF